MNLRITCCFAMMATLVACKKEVQKEDITKTDNFISVLGIKADESQTLVELPDGGYMTLFSVNVNSTQQDIGLAIINSDGTLRSNTTIGGTAQETAQGNPIVDASGNIYIVGLTRSKELRMDKYVNQTNGSAGYLAKLDPQGNLLWQRGYSDTTAPFEGAYDETFYSVYIIDDKIYCYGSTDNYVPADGTNHLPNGMLVVFDLDGNVIRNRLFENPDLSGWSGVMANFAGLFPNNDLLIVSGILELFNSNRNFDTCFYMTRYNPITDQIVWKRSYPINTPEGDAFFVNVDKNGNITGSTSTFSHFVSYNGSNGDVLFSNPIASDLQSQIFIPNDYKETKDGYIFYGSIDNGVAYTYAANGGWPSFHNSTPAIISLSKEGKLNFNRFYTELPKSIFSGSIPQQNGNILMIGGIYKYESRHRDLFMLTLAPNGDIVAPK